MDFEETAVPTLKVMRLQSPNLEQPTAGSLESRFLLSSTLALPDSFGVIHVGETFTAYLGAINVSQNLMVRRLTVSAQLQTPSHRYLLPSSLDAALGVDVSPGDGVDAVVSRALEESGQHILRVEVGYLTSEGTQKTLRKFYRFNVSDPLTIKETTARAGDNACFVSVTVENSSAHAMVISLADFHPREGLVSRRVGGGALPNATTNPPSSTDLLDNCGRLEPKSSVKYLFHVETVPEKSSLGIAGGDQLGQAVLEWRKAMGESGRIKSAPIKCPTAQPPGLGGKNSAKIMMGTGNQYVVYGSGLSVDVASAAANRAAGRQSGDLDKQLSVTVEPIDPPTSMKLASPQEAQLLVVNHSSKPMNLQLQFRLNHMSGVAVCGKSFRNLGQVDASGGSVAVKIRLLALVAGLLRVQGCCIVELGTGEEIPQPPLFHVFVDSTQLEQ